MEIDFPKIVPNLLALMTLSLLPFLVVMCTAYTKIAIVLMLLRSALGVQQAPSGLVLNAIALTLTAFITFPLVVEVVTNLQAEKAHMDDWEGMVKTFNIISSSVTERLQKIAFDREIEFFMQAAFKLWPPSLHGYVTEDNLLILLPAHITSEITRAFEISFLLFLPFVVIDMLVSNVLLAMGAMMVPPMLLSLPTKLLLFVAADGWTRLLHGLLLSYV